jgi:hypothetical protein
VSLCVSDPEIFLNWYDRVYEAKNLHQILFVLQKTTAETHHMLQEGFGDNAMSQSKTFLWYTHFKDGRTSVDDNEHSG